MFRPLAEQIASTDLSLTLQTHLWIVPTSQSIHIISMCVLFTSALVINSRVLGMNATGRTVPQLVDTLLPWMWAALGCLICTGAIQTIAEPVRQFITPAFWAKMIMIVIVVTMTAIYTEVERRIDRDARRAELRYHVHAVVDRHHRVRPVHRLHLRVVSVGLGQGTFTP
jgi:hypothetical protein